MNEQINQIRGKLRFVKHHALFVSTLFAVASLLFLDTIQSQSLHYPPTKKVSVAENYFGTCVVDPYRWLEDFHSDEVVKWVAAQNKLTADYLAEVPERDAIRARLSEISEQTTGSFETPSFQRGNFSFSYKGRALYVRRPNQPEPQILFDPRGFSSDGSISAAVVSITHDGRYLGYSVRESGSDWKELRVRDIATGKDLPDVIRWVKLSALSFTHDGKGFFYSRYPQPKPEEKFIAIPPKEKLFYHRLGTLQDADQLIYEGRDEVEKRIFTSMSADGRYLYVWTWGHNKGRLLFINLKDPENPDIASPMTLLADENPDGLESAQGMGDHNFLGNDGPIFYIETRERAPRGRIITIDSRKPARAHWNTIVPEQEDVIRSVRIVAGRLVVQYIKDASTRIRFFSLKGEPQGELPLPGFGTANIVGQGDEAGINFAFESYIHPRGLYRYDWSTGRDSVLWKAPLHFAATPYESKQVFYRSKDGTKIPMFIVHRKAIALDGSHPTFLEGFGAWGSSTLPHFEPRIAAWLEMGGIYAFPNLRGGGEYGNEWYQAGLREKKQNVFDDFIAAAEYLIREGYTSPQKLVIYGQSGGGIMIGAVMTQRPDLFAVALPDIAILDMLRFHKFTFAQAG